MIDLIHQETLKQFREELFAEGILHEGDTIGTNDGTLLRFLRARRFDLVQSKKMFKDCQQWRKTVEGVGIDELYRRIDPFDFPQREVIFDCWPMWYHKTDKVRFFTRKVAAIHASSNYLARQALEHSKFWKCGLRQTV